MRKSRKYTKRRRLKKKSRKYTKRRWLKRKSRKRRGGSTVLGGLAEQIKEKIKNLTKTYKNDPPVLVDMAGNKGDSDDNPQLVEALIEIAMAAAEVGKRENKSVDPKRFLTDDRFKNALKDVVKTYYRSNPEQEPNGDPETTNLVEEANRIIESAPKVDRDSSSLDEESEKKQQAEAEAAAKVVATAELRAALETELTKCQPLLPLLRQAEAEGGVKVVTAPVFQTIERELP